MWEYTQVDNSEELYHYGVLGMKWGVRKSGSNGYRSTSIRSALARRSNDKVDKSFKDWNENTKKKNNAIELGKKANLAKIAYEKNRSDKNLKAEYKLADKEYKKALKTNTTYRKGVIKQEVGSDISRKYLSEAKKVKKQLTNNPTDKDLKKRYDSLMSKHDVERAKARRAVAISSKRSNKIASIKRGMTMTVKAAAGTAAVAGGVYAVNKYMENHQVTLNGKRVSFGKQHVSNIIDIANKAKNVMGYFV